MFNRNALHIISILLVLYFFLNLDKSKFIYFAPLVAILNSSLILIMNFQKSSKEKKWLKKLKDFGMEFRGYRYYVRPVTYKEIDGLYSKFQILFGNDLLNKHQLKRIHRKNDNIIWFVSQEFKSKVQSKRERNIGFFELFPISDNYEEALLKNSEDGRTLKPSDIIKDRLHYHKYYLGSIGILPSMKYRESIYKGAVLKEFKEFLFNINLDDNIILYTRPVTRDGHRLVNKYLFEKADSLNSADDCIWKLEIPKRKMKYINGRIKF